MDEVRQPPVLTDSLGGVWHSKYRFPSGSRHGIQESEHFVSLRRDGSQFIVESLPNGNKSHIVMTLQIEHELATGVWREETDVRGHYKGAVYTGAIQLVIDDDGQRMHGKWVGAGKNKAVNVGSWELTYVGRDLPVELTQESS